MGKKGAERGVWIRNTRRKRGLYCRVGLRDVGRSRVDEQAALLTKARVCSVFDDLSLSDKSQDDRGECG